MNNPFARGRTEKAEKSAGEQLVELVVIVAVALGLALGIQAFLVKPYRIPSSSMEPTLDIGQRVLVNRIGNRFNDPRVGEVVVFNPPAPADQETTGAIGRGPQQACGVVVGDRQLCPKEFPRKTDTAFIKRVVAGPNDRIRIEDGHVILNGVSQADKEQAYINQCGTGPECNWPKEITVPSGHWFMMGDNRVPNGSFDSRFWGPVPKRWIIGGAFATYWPPSRLGLL